MLFILVNMQTPTKHQIIDDNCSTLSNTSYTEQNWLQAQGKPRLVTCQGTHHGPIIIQITEVDPIKDIAF